MAQLHKDIRLQPSVWLLVLLVAFIILSVAFTRSGRTDYRNASYGSAAHAIHLLHNDSAVQDTGYAGVSEHPSCIFFRSNVKNVGNELRWGASDGICMDETAKKWLQRSKSNCYSCIHPEQNVCSNPPLLLYHMSLDHLHAELPEANLLSIQAYLMTQDLTKSRFILWALDPSKVYTSKSAWLFDIFSDYLTIQPFDYDKEVVGTPWKNDPFFGQEATLKEHMTNAACFSDLVRMIILHKYGGLWMDTDVIFYQDVTHLMLTSYQFVMRWVNNHILRMEAGSPLTHRWLELAKTMPMNHPNFKEEIIDDLCEPNGYFQIHSETYKYMDIYNGCLLRLLLRHNNTGPADAVLYDLPLGWYDHDWAQNLAEGWFDQDWAKCGTSRDGMSNEQWHQLASTYLAMHNRFPGDRDMGPEDSPLQRVIRIVRGFFKLCKGVHCLPVQGVPLLAYEGFDEKPPEARRRQLLQLKAGSEGWD